MIEEGGIERGCGSLIYLYLPTYSLLTHSLTDTEIIHFASGSLRSKAGWMAGEIGLVVCFCLSMCRYFVYNTPLIN